MKPRKLACIKVENATPEQQKHINRLYRQQKYATVFSILKKKELLDEEVKTCLLIEALDKCPAQGRKILRTMESISLGDLETIGQHADVKCLETAMLSLGTIQRVYLAQEVLFCFNADFKKIDVILKYRATNNIFWTTILKSNMDDVLSYAVSKIHSRNKEMYYKHLLGKIARIVMTKGNDRQLSYVLPYVNAVYWQDLTSHQAKYCCSCLRPPLQFIKMCIKEGRMDVLAVIAQNWKLSYDLMSFVFSERELEAFRIISSYQKLSLETERCLFSNRKASCCLKEFRREYLRYHKVPWYKRLRYKFS